MRTILRIIQDNTLFYRQDPCDPIEYGKEYTEFYAAKLQKGECIEYILAYPPANGYIKAIRLKDEGIGFVLWDECEVYCVLADDTKDAVLIEGFFYKSMSEVEKETVVSTVIELTLGIGADPYGSPHTDIYRIFTYFNEVVNGHPCEDLAHICLRLQEIDESLFYDLIRGIDDKVLESFPSLVTKMVAMLPNNSIISFLYNIILGAYKSEIAYITFRKLLDYILKPEEVNGLDIKESDGSPIHGVIITFLDILKRILPNSDIETLMESMNKSENIFQIESNTKAILRMKIAQIQYLARKNDNTQLKELFLDFFEMLDMVMELLMAESEYGMLDVAMELIMAKAEPPFHPYLYLTQSLTIMDIWEYKKRPPILPTLLLINDAGVNIDDLPYNKDTFSFSAQAPSPNSSQKNDKIIDPCNPLLETIDKKKFIGEVVVACASAYHKFIYNDFVSVVETAFPHLIFDINKWLKEDMKPRIYKRLSPAIRNNPNVKEDCIKAVERATILDMARIWFWELGKDNIGQKDNPSRDEVTHKLIPTRKLVFGATSYAVSQWQNHIVIKEIQKILLKRLEEGQNGGFIVQAKFDVPSFWNALKCRDLPFIQAGSFSVTITNENSNKLSDPIMENVRITIFNGMHMYSATRFARDDKKGSMNNKIGVVNDRERNAPAKQHVMRLGGNINLYYEWKANKDNLSKSI